MKKIFMIVLCMISAQAQAFDINVMSAWGKKKIEPLAYTVETSGNNLRIYTWCDPLMNVFTQYRVSGKTASFEISKIQCKAE